MSAALEGRYRAALRWYPRAWRADNADAIVGVMLDQAEADGRTAPLPGELRNLAASGVGRRFERIAPQQVRDRVAAIALAIGVAFALIMFVAGEWAPFAETGPVNGWMFPADDARFREYRSVGFGPFASVLVIVYGMWIIAFALVMLRFRRIAIAVLLLTIPVLWWIRSIRFDDIASSQPSSAALIIVALLAVLASIGQPARVSRLAVSAMVAGVIALVAGMLAAGGHPPIYEGRLSGQGGVFSVIDAPSFSVALVIAGVFLALMRRRAWAVAALVSAAPWLLLAAFYLGRAALPTLAIGAGTASVSLIAAIVIWNRRSAASARVSRSS